MQDELLATIPGASSEPKSRVPPSGPPRPAIGIAPLGNQSSRVAMSNPLWTLAQRCIGTVRRLHARRNQSKLAVSLLLAAILLLAWNINKTYPVADWLFPRYLAAWALTILFNLASLAAGWQVLRWVTDAPPTLQERLVLSHALGILIAYLGLFLVGIFGGFGTTCFWVLPLLLFGFGAPRLLQDLSLWLHRGRRSKLRFPMPHSFVELLTVSVFVVGLVAVYLQILTPDNASFDAEWYHLSVAQQYVTTGGIRRFDEGWYLGAYPQLASLIYAWAFLAPGSLFDRVILCSHIEYSLLIATLVGVSALVRRLLGRGRYFYAGAAMFLFPSLFIYDSGLSLHADHIHAFWAAPVAITLLRLSRRFSAREAILGGALAAGAMCTKYQSCLLLVPAGLLVGYLTIRQRRYLSLAIWVGVVTAITSTHWLKNLIYYRDPLYPLLNGLLPSTPFHPNAAETLSNVYWAKAFLPEGRGFGKLANALSSTLRFPFVKDARFEDPTGLRPTVGAIFTLLLPCLLFVRVRLRLAGIAGGVLIGIFVWYLTSHQDRFLQVLLPWMAAFVAALIVQLWRQTAAVRIVLSALVALQMLEVANGYFTPSHTMTDDNGLRATLSFFGRSFRRNFDDRLVVDKTMEALTRLLPRHAKVLGHSVVLRLGLMAEIVVDAPGWQGAIEYTQLDSPNRVAALWKTLGVTHVLGQPNDAHTDPNNLTRELVYARAIAQFGRSYAKRDGWELFRLEAKPQSEELAALPTRIAWLACDSGVPLGVYAPKDIGLGLALRSLNETELREHPNEQFDDVNAVVLQDACDKVRNLQPSIEAQFKQVAAIKQYRLWLRK